MNFIHKLFVVIGVSSFFVVLTSCGSQNSDHFARLQPGSDTNGVLASNEKPSAKGTLIQTPVASSSVDGKQER